MAPLVKWRAAHASPDGEALKGSVTVAALLYDPLSQLLCKHTPTQLPCQCRTIGGGGLFPLLFNFNNCCFVSPLSRDYVSRWKVTNHCSTEWLKTKKRGGCRQVGYQQFLMLSFFPFFKWLTWKIQCCTLTPQNGSALAMERVSNICLCLSSKQCEKKQEAKGLGNHEGVRRCEREVSF